MVGACSRCKLKKLKCDGLVPSCSRCHELGLQSCYYPPDKRVDKRRILNGQSAFVFKHSNDRKRAIRQFPPSIDHNEKTSSKFSGILTTSSLQFPDNNVLELPKNPDQLSTQTWSEIGEIGELPCDFDIDQFFQYLDGSLNLESYDKSIKNSEVPIYETCNGEAASRQTLIDAVFENEDHTPQSISRAMIELIALTAQVSEDESFLLSTVLTLGALTLAKRDFVEQRSKQLLSGDNLEHPLRAPFVASEAYIYFLQAREYIPKMVENPTRHGFRGLSLISNLMSMLLTTESQMYVSYHALHVAVSIGLDKLAVLDAHSDDFGLVIALWEIWSATCMLSSFHGVLPPIKREDIKATLDLNIVPEYASTFFQLRVQLAELLCQVTTISHPPEAHMSDAEMRRALMALMLRMNNLEEQYATDEHTFKRQELLILELKCWKSQVNMLSSLPSMVLKVNVRAVVEARNIIKELWSYYNPDSIVEGSMLAHLDWNFTYPLRTATICAFTATTVISRFISSEAYLTYDYFEYQLGRKVLITLTSIMPVNKHFLLDLDAMRDL